MSRYRRSRKRKAFLKQILTVLLLVIFGTAFIRVGYSLIVQGETPLLNILSARTKEADTSLGFEKISITAEDVR